MISRYDKSSFTDNSFFARWRIFLRNPLIRLSATFSLSEKAKNELVASHQKDQIYKSNQRLKNPHPVVDR
jgi:hypothetical protein